MHGRHAVGGGPRAAVGTHAAGCAESKSSFFDVDAEKKDALSLALAPGKAAVLGGSEKNSREEDSDDELPAEGRARPQEGISSGMRLRLLRKAASPSWLSGKKAVLEVARDGPSSAEEPASQAAGLEALKRLRSGGLRRVVALIFDSGAAASFRILAIHAACTRRSAGANDSQNPPRALPQIITQRKSSLRMGVDKESALNWGSSLSHPATRTRTPTPRRAVSVPRVSANSTNSWRVTTYQVKQALDVDVTVRLRLTEGYSLEEHQVQGRTRTDLHS